MGGAITRQVGLSYLHSLRLAKCEQASEGPSFRFLFQVLPLASLNNVLNSKMKEIFLAKLLFVMVFPE